MKPYFESGPVKIYLGNALDVLRELPEASVHCVVTSPPYWGLRDYKIAPSVWPKSECEVWSVECEHHFKTGPIATEVGKGNWAQGTNGRGELQPGGAAAKRKPIRSEMLTGFCIHCGAWLGCFGMEPTPELYIEHAVTIFREVRRVLRDDGTLWMNMGDSYANDGKWGGETGGKQDYLDADNRKRVGREKRFTGLKPKDLVGIPWMLAFALRADGWWLRQDIIWQKPNPMPESVTDRCTKAHEYLFLLTKSARYYYDAEAIKEPCESPQGWKTPDGWDTTAGNGNHGLFHKEGREKGYTGYVGKVGREGQNSRMHQDRDPNHSSERKGRAAGNKTHKGVTEYELSETEEHRTKAGLLSIADVAYPMRNKRSVWTIATEAMPEAHFATFPTDLVKPCILAGTSKWGCCGKCGAPWKRVFTKELTPTAKATHTFVVDERDTDADSQDQGSNRQKDGHKPGWANTSSTKGWEPTCACPSIFIPSTVLDPFSGSGTTCFVARQLNCRSIGIELNADYIEIANRRLVQEVLEFTTNQGVTL